MTTGKRIRQLRLDRDLSQKQLAKKFGLHRYTIIGWEGDKWLPGWNSLRQLAGEFGVSIQYLLYGDKKEMADEESKKSNRKTAVGENHTRS